MALIYYCLLFAFTLPLLGKGHPSFLLEGKSLDYTTLVHCGSLGGVTDFSVDSREYHAGKVELGSEDGGRTSFSFITLEWLYFTFSSNTTVFFTNY